MGIITERKKVGAVCPMCRHPDYKKYSSFPKPNYQCQKCEYIWCSGSDGEPYESLLSQPQAD